MCFNRIFNNYPIFYPKSLQKHQKIQLMAFCVPRSGFTQSPIREFEFLSNFLEITGGEIFFNAGFYLGLGMKLIISSLSLCPCVAFSVHFGRNSFCLTKSARTQVWEVSRISPFPSSPLGGKLFEFYVLVFELAQ